MTTVIYHGPTCVDGFTAAWCAWRKFGNAARYIPAQYGDDPPDCASDDVVIVDFSYPRAVLESLARTTNSLLVLDHHATAETELAGLPYCKFDMSQSGAALAERDFHGTRRNELVSYVQDRDLWQWKLPYSNQVSAHSEFSGFQVDPVAQEIDGKDELRFASVLFGGREFVGTAEEVRSAQRAYVESRSKRGKAAA